MSRRPLFRIVLLAIALGIAAHASAAEPKRFGAFSVVCDEGKNCSASVQAVNADKASVFVLSRSPGSRARWTVLISTLGVLADRERPVAVSVDNGVDITLRPVSDYAPFVHPSDYYLVSQTSLDRLMLQVQRGHMLRFSFIDLAGTAHSDRFPLDGLASALNEIDDQQGRISGDRRAGPPVGVARGTGCRRRRSSGGGRRAAAIARNAPRLGGLRGARRRRYRRRQTADRAAQRDGDSLCHPLLSQCLGPRLPALHDRERRNRRHVAARLCRLLRPARLVWRRCPVRRCL